MIITTNNLKAKAYDSIVDFCEKSIDNYMQRRVVHDGDWSMEDLRGFYMQLVEHIETVEYSVSASLDELSKEVQEEL